MLWSFLRKSIVNLSFSKLFEGVFSFLSASPGIAAVHVQQIIYFSRNVLQNPIVLIPVPAHLTEQINRERGSHRDAISGGAEDQGSVRV